MQFTLLCSGGQDQLVMDGPMLRSSPNQGPKRTITGTVVNAISGEPIRHALVQVNGPVMASVLTGADGRFQIENVPEGQISIRPQKPGFFDASSIPGSEWHNPNQGMTVGSGKNDFKVTLIPASKLVGRVTDQDGEPVEQMSLQILCEQIWQGRKQWQPRNGSNTDDDGTYRFDGLLPGRCVIYAGGHTVPPAAWNAPPLVTAPVYYPDSRDLASAQAIDLHAGQETRADLRLHSERGYRVAGIISGVPANMGVAFSLENASGQNVNLEGMNVDPSKGEFNAPAVPRGNWTMVFSSNDGQGNTLQARQEIAVNGSDLLNLQVVLQPAAAIPVTVNHAPSQTPPEGEQAAQNPGIAVMLAPAESLNNFSYGAQMQGNPPVFSIPNVTPGKYRLDLQAFGAECVDSAWYGNVDLLRDYLVVGDGQAQPITINLRSDCATLIAKLKPSEHAQQGFLLVVPSSSIATPKVIPVTGQNPSAQMTFYQSNISPFNQLSPGTYQVYAFSTLDGLEYSNPEALRSYPSQTVTLDPNQKAEITVELTERKAN